MMRYLTLLLLALLVALSLTATFTGDDGLKHHDRLAAEIERLEEDNERLRRENETLRLQTKALTNDDYYLEKVARDQLGLVKPDEVVFQLEWSDSP